MGEGGGVGEVGREEQDGEGRGVFYGMPPK